MLQQADSSVVRADVLSDNRSPFTHLDGGRVEVIDDHYSLSVGTAVNSGGGIDSLNISDFSYL